MTDPEVRLTCDEDAEAAVQLFFQEHWKGADEALFGKGHVWGHRSLTIGAWEGTQLVAAAAGVALAQIARLDELLVAQLRRRQGIGSLVLEAFCAEAREVGARRCFVRCPATALHERFYLKQQFSVVAVIPDYYFGQTFLECVRDLREEANAG